MEFCRVGNDFHCLIKWEQELHESWQARVYMRVFSTFIAWSNENKSCMRVDKREFTWQFSQLSLLDQTRTRVAWELTSESYIITWEFSQLSFFDQTRTRVAWELTSESLQKSFVNCHCLIKREQELHESFSLMKSHNGLIYATWFIYYWIVIMN